jgi:hypothetical protein
MARTALSARLEAAATTAAGSRRSGPMIVIMFKPSTCSWEEFPMSPRGLDVAEVPK